MKTALFGTVAAAVVVGISQASAAPRGASPETGPLIMSGTMVPPAQTRRARIAADKCTPVTIKRRPLSLLSLR